MTQVDRADCALSTLGLRRQGVVRALEMMRLRLADQMSLEYLAKTAAMSRFHFERVFHQITGLPPFVFLSAMRLVRARELVLSTDESITAICFNVGYNSVGTFTRRFTASVGISPRRLRSLTRNREAPTLDGPVAASFQHLGCGSDIVVHCNGVEDDTPIFIGVFPSPVPMGRPKSCAALAGTGAVVLHDVPPGKHYVLAAARPAGAVGDWYRGVENIVGIADATPIEIANGSRQEVTMQLRPVEVTDPPIVSFLPLLLHESCARSLLDAAGPRTPTRVPY